MSAQTLKISLLTLAQLAGAIFLPAQSAPPATDAVYLHTGQMHRGIIIEQKPGASIRLWRTAEGDTLTFDMEAIERIAKVVPAAEPMSAAPAQEPPLPPAGVNTHRWATALQVSVGGGDHSTGGLGAVVQRRLRNQRSWAGLGLSFVGDANSYGTHSIGLAAHGSHEFSTGWKSRLGALAFLDLGYSFNLGGEYVDDQSLTAFRYGNGLHLYTGLRFRVNVLRNAGLWIELGYLRHTSMLRYVSNDEKLRQQAWNMFNLRGSVFF